MKEQIIPAGMVALLLLIAIATRKPTTEATSPPQVEVTNPVVPEATEDAQPVQVAQVATTPAPALLEPEPVIHLPAGQPGDVVCINGTCQPAVASTPAKATAHPAVRYTQSGRRFQPIRRLLGRRR